jgi:integrase
MKATDPKFLEKSRSVFTSHAAQSLADIRAKVSAAPTTTARRDSLSALDSLERFFGKALTSIPADTRHLRQLLKEGSAIRFGVSAKRYANIVSLVVAAVRAYGGGPEPITTRIPLTASWQRLLDSIARPQRRMALYRLACFCSHMGVEPSQMGPQALAGFYEALDAEDLVKLPKNVLKFTIANWNMCSREVPDWPAFKLSSPFRTTPYTLALAAFPETFRADVAAWVERVSHPDVFDPNALKKPLKKATVDGYIMAIRRFASALVHRKAAALETIDSLGALFIGDRFKQGLRFFVDRAGGAVTGQIVALAHDLRNIAKHHCKVGAAPLNEIIGICNNLDSHVGRQLSEKVRQRLRQFDQPENVQRLLDLPAEERSRGTKCANPIRQAKFMERALAIDLLIHTCLRIQNLRTINLETNLYVANGKAYLTFKGETVKNGRQLDFELPDPVANSLTEFLEVYRPRLATSKNPYLFVGTGLRPRSHGALRTAITECLKKRAGLEMHPHLFRHAIGKIVVEKDPGAYAAFSQHLGHARIDTTLSNYLGTETKSAGRHVNRLLTEALADSRDKANG